MASSGHSGVSGMIDVTTSKKGLKIFDQKTGEYFVNEILISGIILNLQIV